MELTFRVGWALEADRRIELDPVLVPLLQAIRREGSLKSAASRLRISYRHAWGLLRKWESDFGTAVVTLERGRGKGAELTELGERLLWTDSRVSERVGAELSAAQAEVNDALADYLEPGHRTSVSMFASHGMAITCLHDLLKEDEEFEVELQIHGSLDSLHGLHLGQCRIAGFHLPLTPAVRKQLAPQYRQWISPARHRLLSVAVREQGIVVKRGNPKSINSLSDLTKRSVRFINRQVNSGTRTTFDELLLQEAIDPADISGYASEEFTHVAVAAMIASGAADAGFAIQAAAERFELGFVPVLQEAYVLALDGKAGNALGARIQSILQSSKFRNRVNNLAGYDARDSGRELSFADLFGGE